MEVFLNITCFLIITIFSISSIHTEALCEVCQYCPDGWMRYQNSCYLFPDTNPVNHTNAMGYCKSENKNSHLITIETASENVFIQQLLDRFIFEDDVDYWLGMSDIAVEGIWTWTNTGAPLSFTDWCPGQPNDYYGHEDCATTGRRHRCNFKWQDDYCTGKHLPLCELETRMSYPVNVVG